MAQQKKTAKKKKTVKKAEVMKSVMLTDDYVRTVKVDDMPDFPDFEFTYRPLTLYEESQLADDVLATTTVVDAAKINVEMITRHITKWTLSHLGNVVDYADEEVVAKIASPLIYKIIGAIRGDGRVTEDDLMMLKAAVKNS